MAKNFSRSTVLTAPSPAASGTSLVVATGQGAWFDDPASAGSFPAVLWPATDPYPTPLTAEIVLVTARTADTFTITRAQENTSARNIAAGWHIIAGFTAGMYVELQSFPGPSGNRYTLRAIEVDGHVVWDDPQLVT